VGEGALALFQHARAADPSLSMTWLSRNAADDAAAAALGIPAVRVTSWRGFWLTLRAEVLVVTHGFGDVNRFATRGGFIVQLWHGIPLKHIHLDSPATTRSPILPNSGVIRRVLRLMYRGASRSIAVFPVASELAAARIRTAFALPEERVVVTGDPRDDVLLRGEPHQRVATARQLIESRLGETLPPRILMFAPTWRDGAPDPSIPTPQQWAAIASYLERTDSTLVIRPHPLCVGDYASGPPVSDRIRLLGSDIQADITPVLPAIDVLITDFSSIAYDYALTEGEILYLAPDVTAYTASRGLYEPYSTFSGGFAVERWDDILTQLNKRDTDPAFRTALHHHRELQANRNHAFRDGRNTVRVYTHIRTTLKDTP
jgi:CDP-glycerol glycerophosphotransferase